MKSLIKTLVDILFLIILITGIIYLVFLIINSFKPNQEEIVNINITGITNSINASTIASLHYECIKECMRHGYDNYGKKACWEACASLGKEECGGENEST